MNVKFIRFQPHLKEILEQLLIESFKAVAQRFGVGTSVIKNLLKHNGIDHTLYRASVGRKPFDEKTQVLLAAESVMAEGWKNPEREMRHAYAKYLMGRAWGDGCGGMTYEEFKAREARP